MTSNAAAQAAAKVAQPDHSHGREAGPRRGGQGDRVGHRLAKREVCRIVGPRLHVRRVRLGAQPGQEHPDLTRPALDREPVGPLDEPAGYDDTYWRRGAELGWTSLLVSEDRGGGSISGRGLVDLTLVAHEFGRHAAPGPGVQTGLAAGGDIPQSAPIAHETAAVRDLHVLWAMAERGPARAALALGRGQRLPRRRRG